MLAVLGVPQMLSSYFDLRERREQRRLDDERRRQEEERRRLEEERRRQDAETAERRHQEMMALMITLNNGRNRQDVQDQSELIRILQQAVADLQAENARLRQQNGNGNSTT